MDPSSESPASDEAALLQCGYRFALSLTHHREEAEDLVQETWLNLCRRYGGVESRAVLFTSLRNLFIDQCRRKKVIYFESLDEADYSGVAEIPADEPCLKQEISGLLGVLRPAEREVIFLHYYEGHTAEEIARMTDQPRGTVLSLLHRAVSKLRKAAQSMPGAFPRNQMLLIFVVLVAATRSPRA